MSNFIKCEGQKYRINLDLVACYYPSKALTDYPHWICFEHSAMTNEERLDSIWSFKTEEERNKVLAIVDKHNDSTIQIEEYCNELSR